MSFSRLSVGDQATGFQPVVVDSSSDPCDHYGSGYDDSVAVPSYANKRWWGRVAGDGGFIERDAHNIYFKPDYGDCDPIHSYLGHHEGVFEEDPGMYRWDVCSGLVPNTPCELCIGCSGDGIESLSAWAPMESSNRIQSIGPSCDICPGTFTNNPVYWVDPPHPFLDIPPLHWWYDEGGSAGDHEEWREHIEDAADAWNSAMGQQPILEEALSSYADIIITTKKYKCTLLEYAFQNYCLPSFSKGVIWNMIRGNFYPFAHTNSINRPFIGVMCDNQFEWSYLVTRRATITVLVDAADVWDDTCSPVNSKIFAPTPKDPPWFEQGAPKFVLTHEFGHAIGIIGHDTRSGYLMSAEAPSCADYQSIDSVYVNAVTCLISQWISLPSWMEGE